MTVLLNPCKFDFVCSLCIGSINPKIKFPSGETNSAFKYLTLYFCRGRLVALVCWGSVTLHRYRCIVFCIALPDLFKISNHHTIYSIVVCTREEEVNTFLGGTKACDLMTIIHRLNFWETWSRETGQQRNGASIIDTVLRGCRFDSVMPG